LPRSELVREAKLLIERIAETPRAAGTEGETRVRRFCADYLERAGFVVTEEDFSYSALPGKWGVPLVGLLSLAWFAVLGASLARAEQDHSVRAAMTFLALLFALYVGLRSQMVRPRFMLRSARNLVAVRGAHPAVWLMAHLDTKSQPVPMLARIAGIILAAAAVLATMVASFISLVYDIGNAFWLPVTLAGAAGSLLVLLSTVGNQSRGALDNATGVAAVLLLARGARKEAPVGVLLTSAEELGLAGAWAWVREQAGRHVVRDKRYAINFDGLDDVGSLTCMSDPDDPFAGALRRAASSRGSYLTMRKVLPGIMVDSTALGRSGWHAVTISKGNFSTLARIHTPADSPDRLSGEGVAEAVEMVANFIEGEV
jgi:hypothetical protein